MVGWVKIWENDRGSSKVVEGVIESGRGSSEVVGRVYKNGRRVNIWENGRGPSKVGGGVYKSGTPANITSSIQHHNDVASIDITYFLQYLYVSIHTCMDRDVPICFTPFSFEVDYCKHTWCETPI